MAGLRGALVAVAAAAASVTTVAVAPSSAQSSPGASCAEATALLDAGLLADALELLAPVNDPCAAPVLDEIGRRQARARALLRQGEAAAKRGDRTAALRAFAEAYRLDASSAEVRTAVTAVLGSPKTPPSLQAAKKLLDAGYEKEAAAEVVKQVTADPALVVDKELQGLPKPERPSALDYAFLAVGALLVVAFFARRLRRSTLSLATPVEGETKVGGPFAGAVLGYLVQLEQADSSRSIQAVTAPDADLALPSLAGLDARLGVVQQVVAWAIRPRAFTAHIWLGATDKQVDSCTVVLRGPHGRAVASAVVPVDPYPPPPATGAWMSRLVPQVAAWTLFATAGARSFRGLSLHDVVAAVGTASWESYAAQLVGAEALRTGDRDAAVHFSARALAHDPENDDALQNLSTALSQSSELDDLLNAVDHADDLLARLGA